MSEGIELFQNEDGTWSKIPDYQLTICFDTEEQMNKFIEKQNKYRWHDLRKDPDDLPSEDGVYRCVFKDEVNAYFDCDYRKDIGFGKECFEEHDELPGCPKEYYFEGFDEDDEVIGWQEIEPFDEEL